MAQDGSFAVVYVPKSPDNSVFITGSKQMRNYFNAIAFDPVTGNLLPSLAATVAGAGPNYLGYSADGKIWTGDWVLVLRPEKKP